jgi:hypothetical protein
MEGYLALRQHIASILLGGDTVNASLTRETFVRPGWDSV